MILNYYHYYYILCVYILLYENKKINKCQTLLFLFYLTKKDLLKCKKKFLCDDLKLNFAKATHITILAFFCIFGFKLCRSTTNTHFFVRLLELVLCAKSLRLPQHL